MRKIAIGSDHAGYEYKAPITEWLTEKGFEVKDFGTYSADAADYADFAHPVSSGVESGEFEKGILLCGSGQGVCITANKHQGIRAALVWDPEIAGLSRQHNDANVICFPVRFIDLSVVLDALDQFLKTEFEGGRHQTRVNKIAC